MNKASPVPGGGVLATSRNAARSRTPVSWRQAWYGPAIFIGLVGITLSVLLEVTGPDMSGVPTNAIDSAVGETGGPARDAKSRTQASLRQTSAPEHSMTASATTADVGRNSGDKENCSDEEHNTVSAWWRCIEELRLAGRHDAAESELRQLLENFPEFVIPKDAITAPGQ